MTTTSNRKPIISILLCVAIICMLVGSLMSHSALTSRGTVDVQSIEFVTENGASMHAVLYIPENASDADPVPGIVANHGFTSNSEAMHLHAIELSRRGCVVIALDAYAHGNTSYPDLTLDSPINDMGNYSALQYLGRLPYVDTENIGMIGHSMGSDCSRFGALRAFAEKEAGNTNVVVPKAILLTSNSFKAVAADTGGSVLGAAEQTGEKVDPINAYPVNYAALYGEFDEFAGMMWAVAKGSDYKTSPQFAVGMGFEGGEYDTFYSYGEGTPLSTEEAMAAADNYTLRVGYSVPLTHAFTLYHSAPVARALEYFDVTLADGALAAAYDYNDQIWQQKSVGGIIAMVGLFMFVITLGAALLKVPFFQTTIKPEGNSFSTLTTSKDKVRYVIIYLVLSACAPLLYTWCSGLSLHNPFQGVIVPVKLPVSEYFQLPGVNGLVLMNLILSAIFAVAFIILFVLEKKKGYTLNDAGIAVPVKTVAKSALLAVILFFVTYTLVYIAKEFFHAEFGAFKLVFMVMPAYKWTIFLKYLPFFLVYFVIHSIIVNNLTKINGAKEWVNMVLIIFTTVGGLALLQIYDLGIMKLTGIKGVPTVPFSSDPNALSGIILWGTLMILPVNAVISRFFYKKTGNVWLGGILNGLIVTFACVCATCIMLPA